MEGGPRRVKCQSNMFVSEAGVALGDVRRWVVLEGKGMYVLVVWRGGVC